MLVSWMCGSRFLKKVGGKGEVRYWHVVGWNLLKTQDWASIRKLIRVLQRTVGHNIKVKTDWSYLKVCVKRVSLPSWDGVFEGHWESRWSNCHPDMQCGSYRGWSESFCPHSRTSTSMSSWSHNFRGWWDFLPPSYSTEKKSGLVLSFLLLMLSNRLLCSSSLIALICWYGVYSRIISLFNNPFQGAVRWQWLSELACSAKLTGWSIWDMTLDIMLRESLP